MKNDRNAEPAFFDEKLLDRVGELRRVARVLPATSVARPADLAQAMAVAEVLAGLREVLRDALAVVVQRAEIVLRRGVPAGRGFSIPV